MASPTLGGAKVRTKGARPKLFSRAPSSPNNVFPLLFLRRGVVQTQNAYIRAKVYLPNISPLGMDEIQI